MNDSSGTNGAGVTAFGTTTINNSIVAGNIGGAATNLAGTGSNFSGNFNLLGPGDQTGGSSDILVPDNDPRLAPLGNNGGPTQTHAFLPASLAIDAGNSTLSTDQRGLTRPFDFVGIPNATGGNGSDIGAFESQAELPRFVVTTASDIVDSTDGFTSLREAVAFANSAPGSDTITFDPSVFTGGAASVIRLQTGALFISESAHIIGGPRGVTISADAAGNDSLIPGVQVTDIAASGSAGTLGDNVGRVLDVTAPAGDLVQLSGLTITGGNQVGFGGGVTSSFANLQIANSLISGNQSTSEGGGLYTVSGNVTLTNSTISGNSSGGGGGGIHSYLGAVTLNSSTLTGNNSTGPGGGIRLNQAPGHITLANSIVADNLESGIASDINAGNAAPGLVTASFSLIGTNAGMNLAESQTADASGNLIGSASGGAIVPLLGPLADNGGPTPTHSLLSGSPALDAGNTTLTADQRGLTRPVDLPAVTNVVSGNGSDIGAVEFSETPSLIVTTTSDVVDNLDFFTSLREAIEFANSVPGDDTITFDPTVFATAQSIQLASQLPTIVDGVTISGPGADLLTVRAGNGYRHLQVNDGNADTQIAVGLSGMTLTGGIGSSGQSGGAIFSQETLTVSDSRITGNRAGSGNNVQGGTGGQGGRGGAIFSEGSLTLVRTEISGNRAGNGGNGFYGGSGGVGGGIFSAGTLVVTGSTVSDNHAGNSGDSGLGGSGGAGTDGASGGGIFNSGALTITGSTVARNQAGNGGRGFSARPDGVRGSGGGVLTQFAQAMIVDTVIESNSNAHFGGGILVGAEGAVFTGSTVRANSSGLRGGGIFTSSGIVALTRSTVSDNNSGSIGGGIHADSAQLSIIDSTISGNTNGSKGAGIYLNSGTIDVTSSTLSGNRGNDLGAGLYAGASSRVTVESSTITRNDSGNFGGGGIASLGTTILGNSIVAGNSGNSQAINIAGFTSSTATASGDFNLLGPGDQIGGANDILVNNNDPLLGPLADNGGTTQTHALLLGSPALDAGNAALTTDQRGFTRPIDFASVSNAAAGNAADIGAFEQQPETPSLIVTTTADVVDARDRVTSLREAINFANATPGADTITFDPSVFTGGLASVIHLQTGALLISDSAHIDGAALGVVVSADAAGNDSLIPGTRITEIAASELADTLGDNVGRVLDVTAPMDSVVRMSGVTVTGGNPAGIGGAITSRFANLEIVNSLISGNRSASNGGGVYASSGTVMLAGSTVSGNTASTDGGGIFARSGSVTLNGSTVSRNSAINGGGIYARFGSVMVSASTVSGNAASNDGGGVYNSSGSVTLTGSTLSGNTASQDGGGIYTDDSTVLIESSTITGNMAGRTGGGIGLLADNFDDSERLTIRNSIVAGNSDNGTAPDLQAVGDPSNDQTVEFSLIGNDAGSGFTETTGIGNLLNVAPLIAPLADNGGTTQTHALLSGSPAINAGDGNAIAGLSGIPLNDQRGNGFSRVDGGRIDIGSFESQFTPQLIAITRQLPTSEVTNADSLQFRAEFSEQVQNTDATDFVVSSRSTAAVTNVLPVQGTGEAIFLITVSGGDLAVFDGTVGIDIAPTQDITDLALNSLASVEPAVDETYTLDNVAPQITAVVVDDGTAQRSMVRSLTIQFDSPIFFDEGAFDLRTASGIPVDMSSNVGAGVLANQIILRFPMALGGSLEDGTYRLRVLQTHIRDAAGNGLDGDGNGTAGGTRATDEFFRFFGDSDGDGDVDGQDLGRFGQTFLRHAADSSYNPLFDHDSDGDVDGQDYGQFARRLFTSRP
ncbi:MAG: choice-of-anchor Q domain-containing protein [Planctomycetota bacterium]